MEDIDLFRERWLDPDPEEPEAEEQEPTEEELADQLNEHVLRAWNYLADNSKAIDDVLEQIIEDPKEAIPMRDQWLVIDALRQAVEATKTAPVDAGPSAYRLLKAAKFLIEGQLASGNLNKGLTEQMSDWMRDANRYFTKSL